MFFLLIKVPDLGMIPQAPGPKDLFNILLYLISGKYTIDEGRLILHRPSGLHSMSSVDIGALSFSMALSGNFCAARPGI